jgi:hypothetical protein
VAYKNKADQAAAARRHYLKNKAKFMVRGIKAMREQRNGGKAFVAKIKAESCCTVCGFKDPRALHFHHLRDKEKSVSEAVNSGWSLSHIQAEIDKCILLCANCHMIHHHDERVAKKTLP